MLLLSNKSQYELLSQNRGPSQEDAAISILNLLFGCIITMENY